MTRAPDEDYDVICEQRRQPAGSDLWTWVRRLGLRTVVMLMRRDQQNPQRFATFRLEPLNDLQGSLIE